MSSPPEFLRRFEGREALQRLLTSSGSLADVEDVVEAFLQAIRDSVPAPVVIQALWEEEPRFESPAVAEQTFGNLLGLFDLLSNGEAVDLTAPANTIRMDPATAPEPYGDGGPDEAFIAALWKYFDENPREHERHDHSFDNRHDALVSWLDANGLSDEAFGLARHLLGDVYAIIVAGGRSIASFPLQDIPVDVENLDLPLALVAWIDDGIFEAEQDDVAPMTAPEAARTKGLVQRAAAALWAARVSG
jgi:hypothetical protein